MKKIQKLFKIFFFLFVVSILGLLILKIGTTRSPEAPSSSPPKSSHKTALV